MNRSFVKIPLIAIGLMGWVSIPMACSGNHATEQTDSHDHDSHDDHDGVDPHDEKEHAGHDHSGLISLDRHEAERFGVRTEKIEAGDFTDVILVSGRIESKASDEGIATATRSGILTLQPDINTGVKVVTGAVIGNIRSASVQGGDPSVQAVAARDAAKRELDRLAPLHKDGVVSTQKYNEALAAYENAEASLRSSRQGSASIVAPKAGIITQLLAKTGEYVETGQKIAVISGNTKLTLRADVPEKYMSVLAGIESANFRAASSEHTYDLEDMGGKLISNSSVAVAQKGYIPMYFSFDNNGQVTPGTFAEIYLKSATRHSVVSVPKVSIVEINGNKCVYTRHGEGHYEKHVVKTGASDGMRIEILSGLNPGEEVVVDGAQVIRMAETSATAVPGHTHNH